MTVFVSWAFYVTLSLLTSSHQVVLASNDLDIPDVTTYTNHIFSMSLGQLAGLPDEYVDITVGEYDPFKQDVSLDHSHTAIVLSPLPPWLIFNNSTKILEGIPGFANRGQRLLGISAKCRPQTQTDCQEKQAIFQIHVVNRDWKKVSVKTSLNPTQASPNGVVAMSSDGDDAVECGNDVVLASLLFCASLGELSTSSSIQLVRNVSHFSSFPAEAISIQSSSAQQLKAAELGFQIISAGPGREDEVCRFDENVEIIWQLPCEMSKHLTDFVRIIQHNVDSGRFQEETGLAVTGWYIASSDSLETRLRRRKRKYKGIGTPIPTPTLIPPSPSVPVISSTEKISSTAPAVDSMSQFSKPTSPSHPFTESPVTIVESISPLPLPSTIRPTNSMEPSAFISFPQSSTPSSQAHPSFSEQIPAVGSVLENQSSSSTPIPLMSLLSKSENGLFPHSSKTLNTVISKGIDVGIESVLPTVLPSETLAHPIEPSSLSLSYPSSQQSVDREDEGNVQESQLVEIIEASIAVGVSELDLHLSQFSFVQSSLIDTDSQLLHTNRISQIDTPIGIHPSEYYNIDQSSNGMFFSQLSPDSNTQGLLIDPSSSSTFGDSQIPSPSVSPGPLSEFYSPSHQSFKSSPTSSLPTELPNDFSSNSPSPPYILPPVSLDSSQFNMAPGLTEENMDSLSADGVVHSSHSKLDLEESFHTVMMTSQLIQPPLSTRLVSDEWEAGVSFIDVVGTSQTEISSTQTPEPDTDMDASIHFHQSPVGNIDSLTTMSSSPVLEQPSSVTVGDFDTMSSTVAAATATSPNSTDLNTPVTDSESVTGATTVYGSTSCGKDSTGCTGKSSANSPPRVETPIGLIVGQQGQVLELDISTGVFQDNEDLPPSLQLSLELPSGDALPDSSWLYLVTEEKDKSPNHILRGLPLPQDMDINNVSVVLVATDSGGLQARDSIGLHVKDLPRGQFTHKFILRFAIDFQKFMQNRGNIVDLMTDISAHFNDDSPQFMTVLDVQKGSLILSWTNNTLSGTACPTEAIFQLRNRMVRKDGSVRTSLKRRIGKHLQLTEVGYELMGSCVVPTTTAMITTVTTTTTILTSSSAGTGLSVWVHIILPILIALVVFVFILFLIFICNRHRKRMEALSIIEKDAFSNDRNPIIFPNEMDSDDAVLQPKSPLVLASDTSTHLSSTDSPQHYQQSPQGYQQQQHSKNRSHRKGLEEEREHISDKSLKQKSATLSSSSSSCSSSLKGKSHRGHKSKDKSHKKSKSKENVVAFSDPPSTSSDNKATSNNNSMNDLEDDNRNVVTPGTPTSEGFPNSQSPTKRQPPPYWQASKHHPPPFRIPPPQGSGDNEHENSPKNNDEENVDNNEGSSAVAAAAAVSAIAAASNDNPFLKSTCTTTQV